MRLALFATAAAAALSITAPAGAQTTPVSASELVVTANRSPRPADRVGQAVTVLNRADIEASQAVIASDLLSRLPGVSFSRNGGPGGVTALRIRGAETDQTVLVIDGVKLNDPSSPGGGYNFADLMVGDLDRIEVLRGSQSTLWGSQAIGGVVNIISVQPAKPFEGVLQAEGGSMSTAYVRGAVGGTSRYVDWRLAAGHYTTDGVSAYRFGTEKDDARNDSVSGRARLKVNDNIALDLRATYSDTRNDFDGFPPPNFSFADTTQYGVTKDLIGYAGVTFDLLDGALKNRAGYSYTRTDRGLFDPAQAVTTRTFDARGENKRWEYQGVWSFAEAWAATFGAETKEASMRTASPSSFDPNPPQARAKAGIDSVYGQLMGQVASSLTLTGGLRRDIHDTFGNHTLGQFDAAWALNGGATVLRASFGQGFKAPTLYQLFGDFGNTGLKPEEADGWDLGVEQHLLDGRARLALTGFQRKTKNQIDFVSCAFTSTHPLCRLNGTPRFGYYDNIARAETRGLELEGSAQVGPLQVQGNYSYTRARNDDPVSANFRKRLQRRPEHQANVQATYAWDNGAAFTGEIRYVGASFDNTANTRVLQSYTLLDLRAAYPLSGQIEVYGRVENVFDDDYETTANYGSPGRAAYVGVRGKF